MPQSTPIIAFQDRGFSEEYLKGTASYHHGRQEFKAGFESDFTQGDVQNLNNRLNVINFAGLFSGNTVLASR